MKFNITIELDEEKLFSCYEDIGIPVKNIEECLINELKLMGDRDGESEYDLKILSVHTLKEEIKN